jgi:hypothetical protein
VKDEITELLPFYANGTLAAAERARVDAELATCASCTEELREIERLAEALRERAADTPPLPDGLLGATLSRLDAVPAPPARPLHALRSRWLAAPARYAAAAALVVGFGAVAAAAWRVHEADLARTSVSNAQTQGEMATVFRVTPQPGVAEGAAPKMKINTIKRPAPAPTPPPKETPPKDLPALAQTTVQRQHKLAKHAQLEIVVPDVETALRRAQTTVRSTGGDVTSLNDASPRTPGTVHGAQLHIEVPAERLDEALDRLAQLGAVQNRTITADDIGDAIVDEEARLKNLRRTETDLRRLMDKGGKVDEILSVQQNLSDVRGQIEQLQAQHQRDVHRVATSTVELNLLEARPNPPAKTGPSARINGAWQSGLGALGDTLIAMISGIVWCAALAPIPLGLAAIAYTGVRIFRRRGAAAP